jgi:hypothetical protein
MQRVCPAGSLSDFDLPPGYRTIAQDANAVIVERMPFPAYIDRPENREFFFWQKVWIHLGTAALHPFAPNFEIGRRADIHIGQTPIAARSFCGNNLRYEVRAHRDFS